MIETVEIIGFGVHTVEITDTGQVCRIRTDGTEIDSAGRNLN